MTTGDPWSRDSQADVIARKDSGKGTRWLKRRTEIVDAAADLFARQGYHGTGIAELCGAVGLGKGSLYYYIQSKEHLLVMIHDRVMTEVLNGAREIANVQAPAPERLRLMGIELVRLITQYPDHVWVFLHEWRELTGEDAVAFRRKRREYEKMVERILVEGIESGAFTISDTRITLHGWLGMHNYIYQWYRPGGALTPMQIATHFHEVFVNGIRASSGGGSGRKRS